MASIWANTKRRETKGLASQIIKQAAHLFLWHARVQPLFGGGLCRPAAVVLTGLVCSGVLEVCARIATFGWQLDEKKKGNFVERHGWELGMRRGWEAATSGGGGDRNSPPGAAWTSIDKQKFSIIRPRTYLQPRHVAGKTFSSSLVGHLSDSQMMRRVLVQEWTGRFLHWEQVWWRRGRTDPDGVSICSAGCITWARACCVPSSRTVKENNYLDFIEHFIVGTEWKCVGLQEARVEIHRALQQRYEVHCLLRTQPRRRTCSGNCVISQSVITFIWLIEGWWFFADITDSGEKKRHPFEDVKLSCLKVGWVPASRERKLKELTELQEKGIHYGLSHAQPVNAWKFNARHSA
jgi:hypothetical protein